MMTEKILVHAGISYDCGSARHGPPPKDAEKYIEAGKHNGGC